MSASASATSSLAASRGFDRGAAVTRSLLGYGVIAGPFYLGVALIQVLVRDGFDPMRHPLSLLANGPGGWVQIANFVITGLMVVAAAVGFARVLAPDSRWSGRLLGVFGVSLVMAGIFVADPVSGFPPGTPEGPPTSISTSGLLHFVAGAIGFLFWAVSGVLTGRALARRRHRAMARYSEISGIVVAVAFFGGVPLSGGSAGVLAIWFSVLAGWAWLTVVSIHLYRTSPDPDCQG